MRIAGLGTGEKGVNTVIGVKADRTNFTEGVVKTANVELFLNLLPSFRFKNCQRR